MNCKEFCFDLYWPLETRKMKPYTRYLDGVQRNERETQSCKMHTCGGRFTLKILLVICLILWITPGANLECAGLDLAFDILPPGDQVIEFGSTLELFCKLNWSHPDAKGFNARDLQFYKHHDGEKVILPNVTLVNDTTIKVDLVKAPLGSTYYFCALNGTLCLKYVEVGYKPQPVLDFQCTSYNWEELNCSWTPPENFIKTEYKLTYTLRGRAGGIPNPCPNQLDLKNNSCHYDLGTDPPYRQPQEYYYFELLGKNVLGELSRKYTFHHYAHVIPNKPENVTVVSKTLGSAVVGWFIPVSVYHFPPGFRFKIEYKNKWEDWVEADVPPSLKISAKNYTFNITGLKYSHTAYDVRIYLKSFIAKVGPNDWSKPASVTFITPSTIPSQSPLTTQGGFEVVSSGNDTDVFIYWARVSEKFENGDHFTYNVICTRDDGKDCGLPIEKAASFAKFPINGIHSYTFTIYSVNEVGRSVNSSYVFVPKYGSFIQPQSFTKVAYDHGVFELSWKPVLHPDLSNYTIFWCKEEKDLPVPCRGYLDWLTVPKNTTTKNITMNDVTKFYKFAIAANLIDGVSSGMVWSSCVIFHDKVLKKVDDFHISRVGSREVDVVWEIRCAQSSAFRGFAFYYCPVDFSSQDNKCKENLTEEIVKLNESEGRNITLTNLKPFTTYKLQISIISLDGSHQIQLGPRSISKRFFTLEDAPTVPLNLSATSVTNTSVTLVWDLPKEMNGVLQTYKLYFEYSGNEKKISFNAHNMSDNKFINQYEVRNLVSFSTYNFTLKACTSIVKCSDYSEPAVITTLIGVPGRMMRPQISIINSSMADVSWDSPIPAAGPLNYYQLLVTEDSQSTDNEIFNLTGFRANIAIKACQVKYNTPEFRIRAININENNVTYTGPWSEPTEVHCGSSVWAENSVLIDWISGTVSLLIVSACLVYFIKKGWLQCRKMKDVEVKLPSGLQSQDLEKEIQDYVHLERWPPRSTETVTGSVGTVLAPDEESLLDKKSDESMDITSFNMPIKNGGDSSGCSVGRESVSSSITSDTHISSDSGAEPDQFTIKSPPFELWNPSNPVRRNPNENLRNNGSKDGLNCHNLGDWDLGEPAIPGYTKVGFGTNCFQQDRNLPGKGYVTIASVASSNPSQKTTKTNTSDSLMKGHLTSRTDDPFPSNGELKNFNEQPNGSKYVSLAHFEGQKMREATKSHNCGRNAARELPKLSRLDESSERDDEKTEDSTEEDFSGKETDSDTIHEVPIAKNLAPMPPYVSMTDNPNRTSAVDLGDDEEEQEEKEEDEDEKSNTDVRLSSEPMDLGSKVNGNRIDCSILERVKKENDSFSNYIPHHLFGKESVNT